MSQQSDMASVVYNQLRKGVFSAARLVRELRQRWGPGHHVPEVHGFVREVAYCLLSNEDIELGEVHAGKFTPWSLDPLDAYDKFEQEIMAMNAFLDDDDRYVFHKKQ